MSNYIYSFRLHFVHYGGMLWHGFGMYAPIFFVLHFNIFELNKMYGLVTPEGMLLEAAYNSIQSMGNGWFYLKKDGKSGVLRVL